MVEVLLGYLVLFAEWQCGLPQTTGPPYLYAETLNPAQARTGRDGTGLGLSSTLLERLQFKDRERERERRKTVRIRIVFNLKRGVGYGERGRRFTSVLRTQ